MRAKKCSRMAQLEPPSPTKAPTSGARCDQMPEAGTSAGEENENVCVWPTEKYLYNFLFTSWPSRFQRYFQTIFPIKMTAPFSASLTLPGKSGELPFHGPIGGWHSPTDAGGLPTQNVMGSLSKGARRLWGGFFSRGAAVCWPIPLLQRGSTGPIQNIALLQGNHRNTRGWTLGGDPLPKSLSLIISQSRGFVEKPKV